MDNKIKYNGRKFLVISFLTNYYIYIESYLYRTDKMKIINYKKGLFGQVK